MKAQEARERVEAYKGTSNQLKKIYENISDFSGWGYESAKIVVEVFDEQLMSDIQTQLIADGYSVQVKDQVITISWEKS